MRVHRVPRLAQLAGAAFLALSLGCGSDSGTGPIRLQVQVFAMPASIPANGTSTITAQVTNNLAQPAAGATIEWGNNFGQLFVRGGATDASGRATATLQGQGAAGVATVTAAVVGSGEKGQVEVRIGLD